MNRAEERRAKRLIFGYSGRKTKRPRKPNVEARRAFEARVKERAQVIDTLLQK
jgi:hypothetical protein